MYNLKIIKSGDRIEIFKINNYIIKKKADEELHEPLDESIKAIQKELRKEKREKNLNKKDRKRSLKDAKNHIMRLVRANEDMKTFITLTFKEEKDYKESKKYLNIFFTKLRRVYKDLKYLWCLEYGDKTQRLHFHVLCNIPIKVKLSKSNTIKNKEHKALENYFEKHFFLY